MNHRELGFEIARCRNITDLDQLRDENLEVINAHPYLYRILCNVRKRLHMIRRMRIECTPISEMN